MTQLSRRDERGITHLLFMAGAISVIFVVIFAGYLVLGHHTNKDAVGYTTPFNRCLSANNNDRHLCNFQKDYVPISQTSYTATVSVTSPQGTVSNLTYSSDGKGNSQVVGSTDTQQLSSIILGGNTYVKASGSSWIEYPSGDANAPAQFNPTDTMDIGVGQSNLSYLYQDTEACGSLTCYKYTISDKTQPAATQTIWYDTTSYRLREWSYRGTTGLTTMNISYQPVTITAPSPVSTR